MREKILIAAKKLMLACLAILAVVGLGMTRVSALSKDDKAELKITNIQGGPTVTLYKIGEGVYNTNDDSFIKFKYVDGVKLTETGPTSKEITTIANKIADKSISPKVADTQHKVNDTYTYKSTGAGVYIAVLTGTTDGRTFNPILLAASYNGEGKLVTTEVSSKSKYLYGQTSVVKSSLPSIDKEVSGTTQDNSKDTASLGQVVSYKLTVELPSYATEAVNKTVYISDTMSEGLTFDFSSLTVEWNGKTATVATDGSVKIDNTKIATAKKVGNGFNLSFVYDALKEIAPKVSYKAVINEKAVVGEVGNTNTAEFFYSNNPTSGNTYEDVNKKPDEGNGITKKEKSKTVYTYQVAFKKVDEKQNGLANAIFGIYSDKDTTKLVDIVTTNSRGYAVSTQVGRGIYYIKELQAPAGYSLNTKVYNVTADWTSSTTKTSVDSTNTTYTTDQSKAANKSGQVGWLKDSIFYVLENKPGGDNIQAAYISSSTTISENTTIINKNEGAGTVLLNQDIPNTKLGELPSTGSIGTYLFKAIGSAAMIGAIGIYIVKRRKA
ncbi:TPA: SpaA isopeptide-forming pilin-related protein [Streptococcus pyogenes]|uniref:SpaA isopeptide-forming pilin-related protein n=1 Tax=Streptococcus pyogenes TaxID=1314 RepID=UPI0010D7D1D5|nr:SpaA isopeptide-forming pilin-related protein [Streptococcus pyogenes]HER4532343.1 LPXTG cell wall anchor domain-containing protein [Streptococcus pyogenes NGAS751]HER4712409.1 LPXTG cell wall anchor domain-containing protein [Streptococcus pyogenes NGAS334]WSE63360.1 SpaA isopeptide-forming pilin-related protein [Streptococcus pyogenes]VHE66755.1 fimbrial structural subunit [Streptococcus pyogenes]VHF04580.1 fimbrial structural subunit [Streptococcus pyogenes]